MQRNRDINKTRTIKMVMLLLIYVLSQFMLMFITGQWWDDWIIWTSSLDEIMTIYSQAGSPWSIVNTVIAMALPHWGFRIIVFFLYLASYLFFRRILERLGFFSEEDIYWIVALAMTIPVNDARATLICFDYSVSLFSFLFAFYIVTGLTEVDERKRTLLRILSHVCFLYSYTTQSLLVFMSLVWIYLLFTICKENKENKWFRNLKLFFRRYWDYIVAPFGFYIVKVVFFSPYAGYTNYNRITPRILADGMIDSPVVAFKTIGEIFKSYYCQISLMSVVFFGFSAVVFIILKSREIKSEKVEVSSTIKYDILTFVIGMVVFYLGLFAYIIVRVESNPGKEILTTGIGGRDAILAGFGIAIMTVSFSRLVPVKRTIQNVILIFLIVLGIFHFNDWYLNYQEDWYFQQEFANAIADNGGFRADNTILCDFTEDSPINGTRQYTLNGLYYMVTGKKDKTFHIMERLPRGMDYNSDDCNPIDGVLLIKNSPISNIRLLQIRMHELFAPEKYREDIRGMTDYSYIRINKETSDIIYRLNNGYELTPEVLRTLVLKDE